jgi:membrane-bound metal-dependent hydrolase YbcI (DUF457 family)
MPDLLTHFLIAFLFVKLRKIERYKSLIYLGTVLPDILVRLSVLSMDVILKIRGLNWFFMPLHTPLGILLTCFFATYFFEERSRKPVFINLMTGAFLHLFLDILQIHWVTEYYLFYPFSWEKFEIGLFWPHQSIYFIPVLALIAAVTIFFDKHAL